MKYPADPDNDEVDLAPCWEIVPRQSMETIWKRLHENERVRTENLERLKKVKSSAWLAICRAGECVNVDLTKWLPLIRLLAVDAPIGELKRACPLEELDDEDALKMARDILRKAVSGKLDITDNERVKAALSLLKMPDSKTGDTIVNVMTGVPRDE